jgi:hypothetical protein
METKEGVLILDTIFAVTLGIIALFVGKRIADALDGSPDPPLPAMPLGAAGLHRIEKRRLDGPWGASHGVAGEAERGGAVERFQGIAPPFA